MHLSVCGVRPQLKERQFHFVEFELARSVVVDAGKNGAGLAFWCVTDSKVKG